MRGTLKLKMDSFCFFSRSGVDEVDLVFRKDDIWLALYRGGILCGF